MKQKIQSTLLTLCVALSLLCAESCTDEIPHPDPIQEGNTVIIYMGAENSLSTYSNSDLFEIEDALDRIPENCQVVVFRDSELKPTIIHFTKKGRSTWKEYKEEINSADAKNVESILKEIIQAFPSKKYSLVLWSHGSGWIDQTRSIQRSIIIDNNKNNYNNTGTWLHISELADILSRLPQMEYIMFDACYMQSAEVASELYPYCKHIIGSPTEIPGNGAPYHVIMTALCKADVQGIIEGYASEYPQNNGVALSAISSANFIAFCEETAKYIPTTFTKSDMPSTQDIQIYAPTKLINQMPIPYDMRSAMHKLLNEEDFKHWDEQWQKTIQYPYCAKKWETIHSGSSHCTLTDPEHYGGISINIPDENHQQYGWDTMFRKTSWYNLAGWNITGW